MSTTTTPSIADMAPILLKKERSTATFDTQTCIDLVLGSKELQTRRRELFNLVATHPVLKDRDMIHRNHDERYEKALEKSHAYVELIKKHHINDREERTYVYQTIGEPLPIDVHRAMFIPTLETQMDDEQRAYWLPKANSYEITGAYVQTELGHGSNIQGIETTAHYDPKTEEFILHSPTLTSRKWWPGGLGKTANYCVLLARLILDGKDRGVQAFLVQLRDTKTHKTLPGIKLGDIGPKIGFQSVDNGYCELNHVRIPRKNMLMRFAQVAPDGSFSKPPMDKLVYFTMVKVRVFIIFVSFRAIGAAATIATRFSAARLQGSSSKGKPENQVLDYENQQLTIFPLIGLAYASLFSSRALDRFYQHVLSQLNEQLYQLSQLHASASGLKALLTEEVGNGIERVRRACGGHGYSASSNLPYIFQEYIGACTYEGTKDVLVQQHAAFLFKCLHNPVPLPSLGGLDLLGFLQADANSKCIAASSKQMTDPQVLLTAFQVRALKMLLRADTHRSSLQHLTQASLAHAESIVLACFYEGVMGVQDAKLQEALLQLWQLYGLWRMHTNLGEFRLDDYVSSSQGVWVQEEMLALLRVVRPNAVALVDGFGFTDFELNSAIGRYDGDIYRALVERATHEPLNKTDVVPGYEKYLKPLLTAKLLNPKTPHFSTCIKMQSELADLAPLLLKKERSTASFNVESLVEIVLGPHGVQARKKELLNLVMNDPVLKDRDMIYRNHKERYEKALEKSHAYVKLLEKHGIKDTEETTYVYYAIGEPLPIDVHRSMFIPTLETQMDDEQRAYWLPKALSYQITGAYAQTELGHGSNVQGIETTAHYDPKTEEFILNSPTLTSRKWWPGGLGKTANHCVLHARLFLDGKDRGVQAFLVPLRDPRTHESLPGITLGDIGPKIGFQSIDNGYCALDHIRIPRRNMLMRFSKVSADGTFSKPPTDKLVYFTMVKVRVFVIAGCAKSMAAAVTIGTRFSAARLQGSTGKGKPENQVLDYENQQLTLLPLIGLAYASFFSHHAIDQLYHKVVSHFDGELGIEQLYLLNQLHSSASGLKAFLTEEVANGMERVRRACGGHGYSASSNLPYLFQVFIGACTYEGTKDVLVQQHAAFLLKCLRNPIPLGNTGGLDLLGFLQVDANSKCIAASSKQMTDPQVLLTAFQVRALKMLLRADAHRLSLQHLTQASLAHAESIVLACFYEGVMGVQDAKLQEALLQLWQLYGLWRMHTNLGEFRLDDYVSSGQGVWVQEEMLALLRVVRPNAVALVDGFGFTDFELNSAIGRYDGDIYRALVERATHEPLNKTDVVPGYEKYLKPLLTAKL